MAAVARMCATQVGLIGATFVVQKIISDKISPLFSREVNQRNDYVPKCDRLHSVSIVSTFAASMMMARFGLLLNSYVVAALSSVVSLIVNSVIFANIQTNREITCLVNMIKNSPTSSGSIDFNFQILGSQKLFYTKSAEGDILTLHVSVDRLARDFQAELGDGVDIIVCNEEIIAFFEKNRWFTESPYSKVCTAARGMGLLARMHDNDLEGNSYEFNRLKRELRPIKEELRTFLEKGYAVFENGQDVCCFSLQGGVMALFQRNAGGTMIDLLTMHPISDEHMKRIRVGVCHVLGKDVALNFNRYDSVMPLLSHLTPTLKRMCGIPYVEFT